MARFVAKNIVVNDLAKSCLVSLAYVFGYPEPVMVEVKTNEPSEDRKILSLIKDRFDFRPPAIVERLDLRYSKYLPTATYGHFCDPGYSWEKIGML